jgi:predicted FMN-binding regulatory protein PaiB
MAGDVLSWSSPLRLAKAFISRVWKGKLKLRQNRSLVDQQRVAATLQQSADPMSRDIGVLMQQRHDARRT